jgi:hypothetical protein
VGQSRHLQGAVFSIVFVFELQDEAGAVKDDGRLLEPARLQRGPFGAARGPSAPSSPRSTVIIRNSSTTTEAESRAMAKRRGK